MGMTSRAKLIYGVDLGDENDGVELPWNAEFIEDDIDAWWRSIKGYKPPFEMFDAAGSWLPGMESQKDKQREYYNHRYAWEAENPCPVELEWLGHPDYAAKVLTVKGSNTFESEWSEATEINLLVLSETSRMEATLQAFCAEYGITPLKGPCWILGAYYG